MVYDAIIIGAGPAGLTSALYLARANKKIMVIENYAVGGQAALTQDIENYPGFQSISGMDLTSKIQQQAEAFGAEFVYDNIVQLSIDGDIKEVFTEFSGQFQTTNLILAMGARARMLGVDKESQFIGRGVSYCATCDGSFFRDKSVAIVGGGDTALTSALYLHELAKEVFIIHRRNEYRGSVSLVDKIRSKENITELLDSKVIELLGGDSLEGVEISNNQNNEIRTIHIQGLFVSVGNMPQTDIVKDKIKLDKGGYIITDEDMQTSVKGVYAVGDVRVKRLRQVITACADGAVAATHIYDGL